MGTFEDTFKPVDVSRSRDALGEEEDLVADAVDAVSTTRPLSTPIPTPPQEGRETPDDSFPFTPVAAEEGNDSFPFTPAESPESTQDAT